MFHRHRDSSEPKPSRRGAMANALVDTRSVRFRFIGLTVLILSIGLGLFAVLNQRASEREQLASLNGELDNISARLATSLRVAVWEFNTAQIGRIVEAEMSSPNVDGVLVSFGKGDVYGLQKEGGHLEPLSHVLQSDLTRRVPIESPDGVSPSHLGEIEIFASRRAIDEGSRRALRRIGWQIVALNIIAIAILYLALTAVVTRPLGRVSLALRRIAEGEADLGTRLPVDSTTEFRAVSDSFNAYLQKLQRMMGGSHHDVYQSIRRIGDGDLEPRTSSPVSEQGQRAGAAGHDAP